MNEHLVDINSCEYKDTLLKQFKKAVKQGFQAGLITGFALGALFVMLLGWVVF